ncbi:hypothetical protein PCANC_23335 [Puccinia coronata f. sp. avenae]|uniref:Uncharacterized protein n=1 Tax=Puccinia coronata f. sp. avenae TaxID=200324 RepID=A0A2N5SC30_9BASI|nr:hypothetical protein PCANC_23335 [Puccinia coronata f. sp. avenae]
MRLGALKELASSAMLTMLMLKSFTSAAGIMTEDIKSEEAVTTGSLSPSARNIFEMNANVDPEAHLKESRTRFDDLHKKIHKSVSEGHIVHVEDGEADDLWHDLLEIQQGLTPQLVLLSGGYYKLRAKCANDMWDYFARKFGIEKPKLATVYANTGDALQNFDHVEGTGLLSPQEIETLKEESSSLSNVEYRHAVEEAQHSLQKILEENDFTTIAVKTTPAEILDLLEAYKHKVAIIWTGPVDKMPNSDDWATKFNFVKAPKAGDRLLETGVPIVAVSPSFGNARMHSIVDQKFMQQMVKYKREDKAFLPTDDSFPGFKNLASIAPDTQAKFSNYIISLADSLTKRMIADAAKKEAALNEKERALNQMKEKALINGKPDLVLQYEEEIKQIGYQRVLALALPNRWSKLARDNTDERKFREFCPVDQTLQLVTDPEMKESLKEVIEVEMKRPDTTDGSKRTIGVKPKPNSNIFLVTQVDTGRLEDKIQSIIDWMAQGEKPNPRLHTVKSEESVSHYNQDHSK